jgi:MFS family permease
MVNKRLFYIFALSASVYFTQGFEGLPGQSFFVYCKTVLKFDPSTIMYLGAVAGIAWLIKPLLGAAIDRFFGKKKWFVAALFLSVVVCAFLGTFALPVPFLVVFLTLFSACASVRDIAVDGIMCVEGKKQDICGKIQSVQWISVTFAGLLTGIGGGYIAQNLTYQAGFLALIPTYLVIGYFIWRYRESSDSRVSAEKPNYKKIFGNRNFIYACIFIFLYKFSPSFGTPLSFIVRDQFHWSEMFIGILGTITAICSIAGAVIYYKISKKVNARKWIVASIWIGAITTLFYLYYTPISAIAYDVVFSVVGMIIHLIVLDFMARTSVDGMESTTFAALCAVNNIAGTCSSLAGAWLLPLVGLQPLIIISAVTSFASLMFIKRINFSK